MEQWSKYWLRCNNDHQGAAGQCCVHTPSSPDRYGFCRVPSQFSTPPKVGGTGPFYSVGTNLQPEQCRTSCIRANQRVPAGSYGPRDTRYTLQGRFLQGKAAEPLARSFLAPNAFVVIFSCFMFFRSNRKPAPHQKLRVTLVAKVTRTILPYAEYS